MLHQTGNHVNEGREWENLFNFSLDFCVLLKLVVTKCNSDIINNIDTKKLLLIFT